MCRSEAQDNSGTAFSRTDYTYYASGGATGGLLKTASRWPSGSGTALVTTYSSYNDFGSPLTMTDEAGMDASYTYNGWNAVTSITPKALLDENQPPTTLSPVTSYAYNNLRALSTVTLPKGNQIIYKYFTDASTYGRLKAWAKADSSGTMREILRYDYDAMGNARQDRVLDAITASSPCYSTLENCTTYDVFHERIFNANRQLTADHLYASSQGSYDATKTFTYNSSAQLTQVQDYLGVLTKYSYDALARQSKLEGDQTGIDATTQYAYDGHSQLLTTTSPTSVDTRSESDDFHQLVLDRSKTRGDIRYEYDAKGAMTKRRRSSYNSTLNQEDTCYASDWLGRRTSTTYGCGATADWTFYYDTYPSPTGSACPAGSKSTGRLTAYTYTGSGTSNYTKALCYHPNGAVYGAYQQDVALASFTTSGAQGTTMIYDLNQNLKYEYLWDRPSTRSYARTISYTYDSTLLDRVKQVQHQLAGASSWTDVTSGTTLPTYFALGGFKTLTYANGITETNTRDLANRLTLRQTAYGATTFTKINLSYDYDSNVTLYDDSLGLRHLQAYAKPDNLNRLRCLSRGSISSCSGSAPWESQYNESFDYDASGNRTNRKSGQYASADEDQYSYVTGPTDIISQVVSGGTTESMSHTFRGEISAVNQPESITYTFDQADNITTTNDALAGNVTHAESPFSDRHTKVSWCSARPTYYYYTPTGAGGTSSELQVLDLYNTCASEYPRTLQSFIYLEGRPVSMVLSTYASGSPAQTEVGTYWIHTDHLGTPVLVTQSDRTDRWRWENDPFGRADPIEYPVSSQAVSPVDDPSGGGTYNTCCCTGCDGITSCGAGTAGCATGCCQNGTSQAVIWSKNYSITGAIGLRVHFSAFDVHPGSTSRTSSDYVQLTSNPIGQIANLTGNLGAFWSPWSSDNNMLVRFWSDNVADATDTRGFAIDKLEYTASSPNGQFVMHLRMPGQIWDDDVKANNNFHRWYRREDGRYLSPDPIGLAGGAPGYSAYANSNPLTAADSTGLIDTSECHWVRTEDGTYDCTCPGACQGRPPGPVSTSGGLTSNGSGSRSSAPRGSVGNDQRIARRRSGIEEVLVWGHRSGGGFLPNFLSGGSPVSTPASFNPESEPPPDQDPCNMLADRVGPNRTRVVLPDPSCPFGIRAYWRLPVASCVGSFCWRVHFITVAGGCVDPNDPTEDMPGVICSPLPRLPDDY